MINNCVLSGRLACAPEIKVVDTTGSKFVRFTLAIPRPKYSKDDEVKTDFIRCVAWNNQASFIERFFHKGDGMSITGRIAVDEYTDRVGQTRTSTNVVVDKISFPPSTKKQGIGDKSVLSKQKANTVESVATDDSDLPF